MVLQFADTDEKFLFGHDLNTMVDAHQGNGVIVGLATTPSGVPDMQTHVAVGTYIANGTIVIKSSITDLTHDASDPSDPRYDVIQADDGGTIDIKKGTAASSPIVPDHDANHIRLAIVYIAAGTTTITSGAITDARIIIKEYKKYVYVDFTNGDFSGQFATLTNNTWCAPVNQYALQTITYDFSKLPAGSLVYFEAVCDGPAANDVFQIRLYNQTDASAVAGGELSWTNTTVWSLQTSADLYSTLAALGTEKVYVLQAKQTANTSTIVGVGYVRFRIVLPY
jgi:hypothetical protein